MGVSWDWLRPLITAPYIPALGPVHPQAGSPRPSRISRIRPRPIALAGRHALGGAAPGRLPASADPSRRRIGSLVPIGRAHRPRSDLHYHASRNRRSAPPKSLLKQLPRHGHALDLVGVLVAAGALAVLLVPDRRQARSDPRPGRLPVPPAAHRSRRGGQRQPRALVAD